MSTTSASPLHAQLADMRKRIQRLEDIALLLIEHSSCAEGAMGERFWDCSKQYWKLFDEIRAERGVVEVPLE